MTIAFVVDIYKDRSNGTSMSPFRCAKELIKRGHEVRIIATQIKNSYMILNSSKSTESTSHFTKPINSTNVKHITKGIQDSCDTVEYGEDGEKLYLVRERYIPIVTEISHKQHMVFGAPDDNLMRKALQGCDIVHLFLPFALEIAGIKLCRELKIPYTTAFHLQPQHISYNMNMDFEWFNDYLFRRFFRVFYTYAHHIHCPSRLMQDEIMRIGYGGKKYIISNGFDRSEIDENEQDSKNNSFNDGFFHIASVGRFSKEKRQDILIKAIAKSRYAHKIKLHLHGLGPKERYLKNLCDTLLSNPYEFGFIDNTLLLQKLKNIDLYCHPAQVESEAISCLEAISLGVVPIIADSKVSATNQFALDSRSIFKTNNIEDLSEKITYWIENVDELESMGKAYKQSTRKYALSLSIDKLLEMFEEAIRDFRDDGRLFEKVNTL